MPCAWPCKPVCTALYTLAVQMFYWINKLNQIQAINNSEEWIDVTITLRNVHIRGGCLDYQKKKIL